MCATPGELQVALDGFFGGTQKGVAVPPYIGINGPSGMRVERFLSCSLSARNRTRARCGVPSRRRFLLAARRPTPGLELGRRGGEACFGGPSQVALGSDVP